MQRNRILLNIILKLYQCLSLLFCIFVYKIVSNLVLDFKYVENLKKKSRSQLTKWATSDVLFTGAIPLPLDAGAFACGVTTLSHCTPHYDQPGLAPLPMPTHIDAKLSVDTRST